MEDDLTIPLCVHQAGGPQRGADSFVKIQLKEDSILEAVWTQQATYHQGYDTLTHRQFVQLMVTQVDNSSSEFCLQRYFPLAPHKSD